MTRLDTGAQPLVSEDGKRVLAVNGEIYNHIAIRKELGKDVKFRTHSDCEVILPLVGYRVLGIPAFVDAQSCCYSMKNMGRTSAQS